MTRNFFKALGIKNGTGVDWWRITVLSIPEVGY